jgi:hypothetical protein
VGRDARTARDDRFKVDDSVGEGGAVECLTGHLKVREEDRYSHRRGMFARTPVRLECVREARRHQKREAGNGRARSTSSFWVTFPCGHCANKSKIRYA